jgi:hypothetical protein
MVTRIAKSGGGVVIADRHPSLAVVRSVIALENHLGICLLGYPRLEIIDGEHFAIQSSLRSILCNVRTVKRNMRTLGNAIAFVIATGLSAGHAGAESSKASRAPEWLLARYGDQKTALAKYAAAMARYRERLKDIEKPVGLAAPFSHAGKERWTWLAADGSIVRRVDDGTFALTAGDCVRLFCLETTCFAAGWPLFVCEDGRERTMSAPDFSTVIFDGITFLRVPPPPAPPDEGNAPE